MERFCVAIRNVSPSYNVVNTRKYQVTLGAYLMKSQLHIVIQTFLFNKIWRAPQSKTLNTLQILFVLD